MSWPARGSTCETMIGSAKPSKGSMVVLEVGDHSGTGGSAGDLGEASKMTVEAILSSDAYPSCRATISSKEREIGAPLLRVLDLEPLRDSIAEITKRSSGSCAADSYNVRSLGSIHLTLRTEYRGGPTVMLRFCTT